ncbi:MAG: type II toxin-antitoxin system HicA family toxin [Candidatus Diapherotrites archaeon]|nr:type II toxin-antitoxin system HicA family toxin [Candidatus Micrarchaeota archaeon]MBU1939925.1 type II toxin-antitoxin system HicA family toxin [Candidatus Micrarchaeota archaeon]
MPKLKPISPEKLAKIAVRLGFRFLRKKGSHSTFANSEGMIVVIPMHSGRKIDGGLLLKIIKKDFRITREDFEKLI